MTLKDQLFSFEGRLRRRDYWGLLILTVVVLTAVSQALARILVGPEATIFWRHGGRHIRADYHSWSPQTLVVMACALFSLWPVLALESKRRHDRDASAKPVVALQLAALLATYFPTGLLLPEGQVATVNWWLSAANLIISAWFLVVLGILDGTPGRNRYGPSPKSEVDELAVFD